MYGQAERLAAAEMLDYSSSNNLSPSALSNVRGASESGNLNDHSVHQEDSRPF